MYARIPDTPVDNWDNGAEGINVPDCPSFEQCKTECEQNTHCFQASYDGKDCTLGTRLFRLGTKKEPTGAFGERKWQSVWIKKRMYEFAKKHSDCTNVQLGFKDAFVCNP